MLANKISLNCSKLNLFSFTNQDTRFKTSILRLNLMVTKSCLLTTKYLGIYLDSTLSGKYHCEILSKKLNHANGMLCKVRHCVPKEELKSIYYAIFSSHMMYGCQVWGQGGAHFEKIIKLQNRALRIINFEDYHVNASPLYAREGILKLIDVIKLQNCLFVHDYLNNALPLCFDDYYFKLNYLYFNDQTLKLKPWLPFLSF